MSSIDALVCLAPGKLRIESRPAPQRDDGRILVRPRRVGICGTDYHIYQGKHPFLRYPRIMGHELAVEVVDAPADAGVAPGDIFAVNPYISCGGCIACRNGKANCCVQISVLGVHEDGGLAGLLLVAPENLLRANDLSTDQCAMVEFLAIGAHAVRRGGVTSRDKVLVVGAGPIGLGVALFSDLAGGTVTMLDRDKSRAAAAKTIVDVTTIAIDDDYLTTLASYTDGEGFDVVFDATGNSTAMEKGFEYVAHGGRYVLVSVVKEPITFMDPDFHRKELTLLGSRNAASEDFEHVVTAIARGNIPTDRLITHRTDLVRAAEDIPRWATEKSGLIKAVVEID